MALDAAVLESLAKGSDKDAWRVIIDRTVEIASKPLAAGNAPSEVIKRDRDSAASDESTGKKVRKSARRTLEHSRRGVPSVQ